MLKLLSRIFIAILFSINGLSVSANDNGISRMLIELEKNRSTTESRQHAITMGKERALLCSQCHGDDGNSARSDVPNLASQNPVYLLKQIEKFADGSRKNFVMNALSKKFTNQDKINLAIYYASMQVKHIKTNTKLAAKGQPLYTNKCSVCHGQKGIGKADYARLAGQQVKYVENTLRRFRDNSRNDSNTTKAKRKSFVMESIAKNLSENDIQALAAYIAQIK